MPDQLTRLSGCLFSGLSLCLCCSPARLLVTARMTDAETGRPLPGALVRVSGSDMLAAADSSGLTPAVEVSRRDTLLASCTGYLDELAPAAQLGDTVRLGLYPDRPRAVSGIVRTTSDLAVDSAVVTFAPAGPATTTLPDGSFLLDDFPAGPQTVVAARTGFPSESLAVRVLAGETLRVALALRDSSNEGTLNGTVGDRATGQPVSEAGLAITGLGRRTLSGHDGSYDFGRVPVGDYLVTVTAQGFADDSVRCRVTRGWAVSVDILLDRRH